MSQPPTVFDLVGPTLKAVRDLGGSARIDEIVEKVAENEGFSDELMARRRSPEHHMGLVEYRLAWARNYLKNAGALENSARGVWSLSSAGQHMTGEEALAAVRAYKADYARAYAAQKRAEVADDDADEAEAAELETELGWKATARSAPGDGPRRV